MLIFLSHVWSGCSPMLPDPEPGFDASLFGVYSQGGTGSAMAVGNLDGAPGDELVIVTQNQEDSEVDVWGGPWTGVHTLTSRRLGHVRGSGVTSVAVTDLTGDDRPDVAVGQPRAGSWQDPNTGFVTVIEGPWRGRRGIKQGVGQLVGAREDYAGTTLHALGDYNRDGVGDLLVGTRLMQVVAYGPHAGRQDLADNRDAIAYDGALASTHRVAMGDISGDGQPDLVLSQRNQLAVSIFTTPVWFRQSIDQADLTVPTLGYGADVGDIDGDGRDDLAVVGVDYSTDAERVAVFHGPVRRSVEISEADTIIEAPPDLHLWDVRIIGDTNGDGSVELAVLSSGRPANLEHTLWIMDPSAGGTLSLDDVAIEALHTGAPDELGTAIAVGDFNNDGLADVAAGAPAAHGLVHQGGAVYVRLGEQ